jgi:hypothetical protein
VAARSATLGPSDVRGDRGAVLELTALRIGVVPYRTVAVDMFGFEGASVGDLEALVCQVLAEFPSPLEEGASAGYSAWLGKLQN